MTVTTLQHHDFRWIAVDKFDDETVDFLRANFRFHHLDLEDVKAAVENPKIETYKHYFFLVLHFPESNSESGKLHSNELDIFVKRNTIVTIPNHETPYLAAQMARLQRNLRVREEWFKYGTSFFCYKLLKGLYQESLQPPINRIAATLRDVDESFGGKDSRKVLLQLTGVRRIVLDLKRIIEPQRFVIHELAGAKMSFMPQEMSLYFDDVRDLLDRFWALIDNYKDIVSSLLQTNESLISLRTSEIIKVLAVISAAFLPLTLLTGTYGMNITHLPFADNPAALWFFLAFMVGFFALVVAVLRKIRWL